MVYDAYILGKNLHALQRRKYTGKPYITHPVAVARILKDAGIENEHVLCAAILHDTIEDTEATYELILERFGKRVADLVLQVTDVAIAGDGNRAYRVKLNIKHLALACPDAQNIKLADLIHNTMSIVKYDPKFAVTYLKEKQETLKVLIKGSSYLLSKASEIVF